VRKRFLILLFVASMPILIAARGNARPFRLDISGDHLSQTIDSMRSEGYRMASFDLHGTPERPRYAAAWERTQGPAWVCLPAASAGGFEAARLRWAEHGFLPSLITVQGDDSETARFAAVLEKDTTPTLALIGLDAARFEAICDSAQRNRSILAWVDIYGTPAQPRFAGVWKRNRQDTHWNYSLGDDAVSARAKMDAFARVWVRPAMLTPMPGGRYFTLWQENSVGPWAAHAFLSAQAGAGAGALDSEAIRGLHPACLQAIPGEGEASAFSALLTSADRPLPRHWIVSGPASPTLAGFDAYMQSLMQAYGVRAGALAMAHDGRLVFAHGYTWAEDGYPVTAANSLFRVASCSKPLTSMVVHRMLREAGGPHAALSLKEKILALLKRGGTGTEQRDPADARFGDITVDQLLTHSGGWVRSRENPDPVFNDYPSGSAIRRALPASRRDFLDYMLGRPLQFEPGSRSVYDNFGYFLLGRIIETLPPGLGRSYENVVGDLLFKPLGLSRPRFGGSRFEERSPGEVLYHTRVPYLQSDPQCATEWVPGGYGDFDLRNMDAAGAWLLSAPDYAKVLASFDLGEDDPILKPKAVATMWSRAAMAALPGNLGRVGGAGNGTQDRFLRGWFATTVSDARGDTLVAKWHNGLFPGSSTLVFYRPDKWSFALFLNQDIPPQLSGDRQGRELSRLADAVARWPDADLFPNMGIPAFKRASR